MVKTKDTYYRVFSTQKEGGGDGTIDLQFTSGGYTISEIHRLIDGLQLVARFAVDGDPNIGLGSKRMGKIATIPVR